MAAAGPRPNLSLENLPTVVKNEISSYLGAEDLASLSKVSKVFHEIVNNPAIWIKVAKKLNVKVTQNPQQDVLAYYKKINDLTLKAFAKAGYPIPQMQDVFLQRRAIEEYVIQLTEREMEKVWDAVFENQSPEREIMAKFLLEANAVVSDDTFFNAIRLDCDKIIKMFLDANVPTRRLHLLFAVGDRQIGSIEVLSAHVPKDLPDLDYEIETISKALEKAIDRGDAEIVTLLLKSPLYLPSQSLINMANDRGNLEIIALLEKANIGSAVEAAQIQREPIMEPIFILREPVGRNPFNPTVKELQGIVNENECFIYGDHHGNHYLVTAQYHMPLPNNIFTRVKKGEQLNVKELKGLYDFETIRKGKRLSPEEVRRRLGID